MVWRARVRWNVGSRATVIAGIRRFHPSGNLGLIGYDAFSEKIRPVKHSFCVAGAEKAGWRPWEIRGR